MLARACSGLEGRLSSEHCRLPSVSVWSLLTGCQLLGGAGLVLQGADSTGLATPPGVCFAFRVGVGCPLFERGDSLLREGV